MQARDVALLVLRVALGVVMFAHGAQKIGWFGGPGTAGFLGWMSSMGVPAPLAWLALLVELVGGPMVLLGVFTRIAALGFAGNMVVATLTVHWKNGFFMGERAGWEFTFVLFCVSVALVLAGPGKLALLDRER